MLQSGLVKASIVILILVVLCLALMWKLINNHSSAAKKRRMELNRSMRHRLFEHNKDAPRIALLVIHDEESNFKKKNINNLMASCLWSNAVSTPYLPHRVIPVVCKLRSKDSTYGIPSYSFCKHGQHDSCGINASLAEICQSTKTMQMLVKTICIHCPHVPSGYAFSDQIKSYLYAIKHLQDTGVNYDYVCIIPSTTCLSYGWDETLIQQMSKTQQSYLQYNVLANVILSSPIETLNEANDYMTREANLELAMLQAQANQSHTSLASSSSSSLVNHIELPIANNNKPGEWDGGNVLDVIASHVNMQSSLLERMIWQTQRRGLYTSVKEFSNQSPTYSMKRFEMACTGQDDTPSLTPWWCNNNLVFVTNTDMTSLLTSFESLLLADVCFSDAEWSMALLKKKWLCASVLKSCAVSLQSKRTIHQVSITRKQDLVASLIDLQQTSKMVGLDFAPNHSHVSPDAALGLLALDQSWFDKNFVQNNDRIKEHDILTRFGAWSRYFALRG